MERHHPFAPVAEPHSAGEFYAFVSGERWELHGAPARIAWEIERLAVLRGWPVGEVLGSEMGLRQQLGASREALREAIRIVESRGAMEMRRGRAGGLTLVRPQVARTAAALAAYLRATDIMPEQVTQSRHGLDQLLAWQLSRHAAPLAPQRPGEPVRHWLARVGGEPIYMLYVTALDELSPTTAVPAPVPAALVAAIAARDAKAIVGSLRDVPFVAAGNAGAERRQAGAGRAASIAVAMAAPPTVHDLGNEAELCERFATSRSVIRQALRIQQDLDMIQVRRGRGGGYARKRPSPIGIIRQLFPWLAAEHSCPFALMDMMWDLNGANLRLAGARLAAMAPDERACWLERLDATLFDHQRTWRFVRLQQALAEVAGAPLIDTLARCIVSYQARSHGDVPGDPSPSNYAESERVIVAALRAGDLDGAEGRLRAVMHEVRERTLESFGIRAAAE